MSTEVLEELDLPKSSLCQDLLAEHICNFFDRNPFVGFYICCSAIADMSTTAPILFFGVALTKQYHRLLAQALSSHCTVRQQ